MDPAPRPPFPGARNVCGRPNTRHFSHPAYGNPTDPFQLPETGFPEPGNRTGNEPVLLLTQADMDSMFYSRAWPYSPLGYNSPFLMNRPRGYSQPLPSDSRTDADFYPGLEGDELIHAWFKEVAELIGWKEVVFYGRSALLISNLVK